MSPNIDASEMQGVPILPVAVEHHHEAGFDAQTSVMATFCT